MTNRIIGYSSNTTQWKKMFECILKYVYSSGQFSLQFNPSHCNMYFCSYHDINTLQKKYPNATSIFISGEPDPIGNKNISVIMDCKKTKNNTVSMYIPFYAISFVERNVHIPQSLVKTTRYNPLEILKSKTKFCAYMYRYDLPHRVQLFDEINRYKKVEPLGKSRNPNHFYKTDGTPYDSAVEKYKPFKFVICCENHAISGYVTEKIVNAMLANSIPIYFGAPDIVEHFNPKSFINVNSFKDLQTMVNFIKQVDQNDALYESILKEPWLNNNVLSPFLLLEDRFKDFANLIKNVLNNPLNNSPRFSLSPRKLLLRSPFKRYSIRQFPHPKHYTSKRLTSRPKLFNNSVSNRINRINRIRQQQ